MVRSALALLLLVSACSATTEDDAGGAAALATDPTCQLRGARFDGALLADLEASVDPSLISGTTVTFPGALTASSSGSFTRVITVLASSNVMDDDPPPAPQALDIMGSSPDTGHADRTAHRIYDAMTRATEDPLGTRTSPNGRVTCEIMGWKGGDIYHCTLRGLISLGTVTMPSAICAP